MLDVRRLRLLVDLSQRGTIAAVAQARSYSASAVSQQLSVLEREAGTTLLEPVGRRVRLTAEGELLVARAIAVIEEMERAEADLEAARTTVTGTVRLAAFQSAVLALVPDALVSLGQSCPDLRVEVVEQEPEVAIPLLVAGDYDLVVAEEYPGRPRPVLRGLDRRPLLSDRLSLVYPRTWGRLSLARMGERPFVMEPAGTTSREWAVDVCRTAGFEPDVRYETSDLQIHLRLVESGLAAAFLPGLAGPVSAGAGTTARLAGRPRRELFTVTRVGARSRPAVAAVAAALAH